VPTADRPELMRLTHVGVHFGAEAPFERSIEAMRAVIDYAVGLAAERRRRPEEDLLSSLVQAEIEGERLSDEDVAASFWVIITGGSDTTSTTAAHAMLAIAEEPAIGGRLRSEPDALGDAAVEEMLRWATPVLDFRRTATADTEIAGQHIGEGDNVVIFYKSANRDEKVFPDPYRFDIAYDIALPQREVDVKQAKFLLKQAGREDLTVDLVTTQIGQAAVQGAQVLAQQAKAGGVTVNLRTLQTSDFFGPEYLKWVFAQDLYYFSPYMLQVTDAFLSTSPYNETHFDNPTYNKLYNEAQATTTQAALTPLEQEMMKIDYEQGGYIIPYFSPVIDAHSPKLQGVLPAKTGAALRNFEMKDFWFSS